MRPRRRQPGRLLSTDPVGELLWISPALPGRTHDLTAARTHRIIRICERQCIPVLADRAHQGASPGSPPDSNDHRAVKLMLTQRTVNRALARARTPVERGMGRLKSWQVFSRSRISPNRMTVITKAVLTLERQRSKRSTDPECRTLTLRICKVLKSARRAAFTGECEFISAGQRRERA
ncbi:transposase family protein [Streptomyces sp. NPDC090026]|uniref:transposase family protein n=1 Tax=Streptomyces sp. NPDC090026 TaxID=3365923 RepID=UPI0037FD2D53